MDVKAERNQAIRWSIGLTLAFTGVWFLILLGTGDWRWISLGTLGYLLLHPFVGKVWVIVVHRLCRVVDDVYELDTDHRWGGWSAGGSMMFAAAWPVSGPIGLVICLVAVLFGIIFRGLFRSSSS